VKELSIFVDESGDFGLYEHHSPFYIVTLVFHDQSADITESVFRLNERITHLGLSNYYVHTGPLIRRERECVNMDMAERKRLFNALYNFARTTDITYHSIVVEKKHIVEKTDHIAQISKQLSAFLKERLDKLMQYERIVVYYDNGQAELTSILVSVFNAILSNVEFRRVVPNDYKLFQTADLLCALELTALKVKRKILSSSELSFFGSARDFEKSYMKAIRKKRF
jgi:hypothetical protein